MYFIRPVKEEDLEEIIKFAKRTALGLISLPRKKHLLEDKIKQSIQSFKKKNKKPYDEFYLFALVDSEKNRIAGTCGIYSKIGSKCPVYGYEVVENVPEENSKLPVKNDIHILKPVTLTGPSELCALYIAPEYRKEGLGKLISYSRFLFIASHAKRFEKRIIARLRGVIHKRKKTAPFWDGLGSQFISMNLSKIMSLREKAEPKIPKFLMQNPVLVPLLPTTAQKSIGQVHSTTVPALKMLQSQGFYLTPIVDFFDAGPMLEANTKEINIIKKAKFAPVHDVSLRKLKVDPRLISNTELDFRCCFGHIVEKNGKIIIDEETAKILEVKIGQEICYV